MPRRKGNQYATIEFENYEEGTIAKISENVPELTFRRPYMVGASGGEYAIFAGGNDESSYSVAATSQVDVYDKNLAHIVPAELSVARQYIAATTGENYTLFGGGYDYDGSVEYYFSTVDAYSMTLVHTTPTELSESKRDVAATTVGNFELFGCGRNSNGEFSKVEGFDNNLVLHQFKDLSVARSSLAATTVSNYALFGGGYSSKYEATVDCYEYVEKDLELTLLKGAKYKFQNMSDEITVTEDFSTISIPTPATGYVKFKNTIIS